jgi:hypothetical protein
VTGVLEQDGPSVAAGHATDPVTWLGGVLAVVAVIELTVLRIGTRTAVHIPDIEALETPYLGISTLGRTAYFVAVVVLVALLGAVTVSLVAQRAAGAAAAVTGVLLVALAARIGVAGGEVVAAVTIVAIGALSIRLISHTAGIQRLALAAMSAAPIVALSTLVVADSLGTGSRLELSGLTVGEALAVAAGLLSPLLVAGSKTTRSSWIALCVAGFGLLVMLVGAGSTTRILMLWNFGLSGYLPDPFYALAAATMAFTIARSLAMGHRNLAVALALLLMGGIGLHSTYQTGLVVAGFALLAASIDEIGTRTGAATRSV